MSRIHPDGRIPAARALAPALAMLAATVGPVNAQAPMLVPTVRNSASTPAPPVLSVPPGSRQQKITMAVGKSIIVDLPSDAAEVFVGKPEVANAVVRSPRRLYVMALAKGPTTIFAMDKDGRQIAILSINVNDRDIGELQGILKTVMPDNDIRVQAVDDSVILIGTVSSAVDAQRALDIATAYTGYTAVGTGGGSAGGGGGGVSVSAGTPLVVPGHIINSLVIRGQDQVTLKVSIVEIRRDIIKQLGVNLSGDWHSTAAAAATNALVSGLGTSNGAATFNYLGQKNSLSSTISAFESNGVAHILAEPNVTAISGETAKFQAGGTIPIPTQSSLSVATFFTPATCLVTYSQQQYGVTLNFTPTVLSGGRISLHISTQVVEPDPSNSVNTSCAKFYGFRQRQNETTVELPSGGSIVSAGLVQQTSQQAISGTPGLLNLPILGALFRSRDYQRNETELMIVVTPYLSKTLRPDQVSKPDDGFTDSSDPQAVLLGRMNRIYSTASNPELSRSYRGHVGFIND